MNSRLGKIRILETVVIILAITNVIPVLTATMMNWNKVIQNPFHEILFTLGWFLLGHLAAGGLYLFLALRFRFYRNLRWLSFFNALIALGIIQIVETKLLIDGIPNMSGVFFSLAPILQIFGSFPCFLYLIFVMNDESD